MIQSMTGFGRAEKNGCRIEIRSLNHRFLDIYIKAPSFLNQHEMNFRNLLKGRFSRGKFDVSISLDAQASKDFRIATQSAKKIYTTLEILRHELSLPGQMDMQTLLNFHEMFIEEDQKYDIETITDTFKQSLEDLYKMRVSEGEKLLSELLKMTELLGVLNKKIREISGQILPDIKVKFNERLKAILDGKEADSSRILQEAAILAVKYDVSEETARIDSHLKQFKEILSDSDIIGRKLDFIVQELNREVNTIASKASDYNIADIAVEMKTVVEQLREQVQNIQ